MVSVAPAKSMVGNKMSAFYHGELRREFVSNILSDEGDFLVRKASDGEAFVLSVLSQGVVRHFQPYLSGGMYCLGSEKFKTFDDLIQFHWKEAVPITSGEISAVLKRPVAHKKTIYKKDDIEIECKLGEGNFGDVFKVRIKSENRTVAMKTLRQNVNKDMRDSFVKEMNMMATMRHENIVQCIGTVDDATAETKILLELINQGSLDKLLKKGKLTERGKARILLHVARGLRYLHEFRIIHRDLAARNILVHRNDDHTITAKISDFGLSRRDESGRGYELRTAQKLPLKWLAPECFLKRCWTTASDVWSYGVLMWEVFTNGQDPYSDMGFANPQTLSRHISAGGRPSDLKDVQPELHKVMTWCWVVDVLLRPTMEQVTAELEKIYPTIKNVNVDASQSQSNVSSKINVTKIT